MNIDKFNSEGYYAPTSYEAMTNVAKADKQSAFRPLVVRLAAHVANG